MEQKCLNCNHPIFVYAAEDLTMHYSPSMYADLAAQGTYGSSKCFVIGCKCNTPERNRTFEWINKNNPLFKKYSKSQKILSPNDERLRMQAKIRTLKNQVTEHYLIFKYLKEHGVLKPGQIGEASIWARENMIPKLDPKSYKLRYGQATKQEVIEKKLGHPQYSSNNKNKEDSIKAMLEIVAKVEKQCAQDWLKENHPKPNNSQMCFEIGAFGGYNHAIKLLKKELEIKRRLLE